MKANTIFMKWSFLKVKEYKVEECKNRTLFLCCSKSSSSSYSFFSSLAQGMVCLAMCVVTLSASLCLSSWQFSDGGVLLGCSSLLTKPLHGCEYHQNTFGNVYWNYLLQLFISKVRHLWNQL